MAQVKPTKRLIASKLRDAAVILESNGWCQNSFYSHGSYCAVGAISLATRYATHFDSGIVMTKSIQSVCRFVGVSVLQSWNDEPKRSKKEVLSALRGTARWLEHGGGL